MSRKDDDYWEGYAHGQKNAHNESSAAGGINQGIEAGIGSAFASEEYRQGINEGFEDGLQGENKGKE